MGGWGGASLSTPSRTSNPCTPKLGLRVKSFYINCYFCKEYSEGNFEVIEKKKSLKQEVSKASAGNHKTWKALCVKGIQEEKHSKSPSSCLILKPRHYTYEWNFCQFFSPEHITISCSPLDLPAPFSSRAINFQNAVTRPYSVA